MKRSSELYDSAHRAPTAWEELRGIIKYRDLIIQLVRRDIVMRYKRSALGITWTMLNPLGMMLVLVVIFSKLFHNVPDYPIYVLCGLVAWNFFAQSTTSALSQNIWGGALLQRIYMPRTTFTISAISTGLVNLSLSFVPLALIMLVTKTNFHLSILFLPVAMLLLAAFSLGVGLLFSTLAVFFPDVVEMFQVALTAWMYLTPIIYPAEIIPETYRHWLISLNPMYYLIQTFRQPVYDGVLPAWQTIVISAGVALFTLGLGWLVFSSKVDEISYRT